MDCTLSSLEASLAYAFGCTAQQNKALSYSLTAAQIDARAANPDPSSEAYFTTMVSSMQTVGWSSLMQGTIDNTSIEAGTNAAAYVNSQIISSLPPLLRTAADLVLNGYLHRLETQITASAAATSVMDAWWGHTQIEAELQHMRVGPMFNALGNSALGLAFVDVEGKLEHWSDLLDVGPGGIDVHGRVCCLQLDLNEYAKHSAALEARVQAQVQANLNSAVLDLP